MYWRLVVCTTSHHQSERGKQKNVYACGMQDVGCGIDRFGKYFNRRGSHSLFKRFI